MSMRQTVFLGSLGWVAAISLLHGIMNLGMLDRPSGRRRLGLDALPFRVGFIVIVSWRCRGPQSPQRPADRLLAECLTEGIAASSRSPKACHRAQPKEREERCLAGNCLRHRSGGR